MSIPPHQAGDIYITRNTDAVGNRSPGYWNHCAMFVGDGMIIEAQEKHGVIVVAPEEFRRRYPHYLRLRYKGHSSVCLRACIYAMRTVGTPYKKIASIWRRLRRASRGENCVSVVRRCWRDAFKHIGKRDPRWKRPDHVAQSHHFQVIEEYEDYENWTMPDSWTEGRLA